MSNHNATAATPDKNAPLWTPGYTAYLKQLGRDADLSSRCLVVEVEWPTADAPGLADLDVDGLGEVEAALMLRGDRLVWTVSAYDRSCLRADQLDAIDRALHREYARRQEVA